MASPADPSPPPSEDPRFQAAMLAIDTAHSLDPTLHTPSPTPTNPNPIPIPYELHYAQRSTHYLSLLFSHNKPSASDSSEPNPHNPSPLLTLAVRAQHFRRWEVPRSSYPMTKIGYHAWRTYLKQRQASLVAKILLESGYSASEAEKVGSLIRKEGLGKGGKDEEEEVQILEDVACLVFLDDQFEQFEKGLEEEKMLGVLRKTWAKMSKRGRGMAAEIEMGERARELVGKALEGA
ncbi:hypothetical protein MMC30_000863 [Trapelia coarctata]|nr:hypothetical protein [Trapelia coarctata]